MQLNDWQKAVARTYGGGDFAHFAKAGELSDDELNDCGDTLFIFLMKELSSAEDCDSAYEATQRLENARYQLDDAMDAVSPLTP